MTPNYERVSSSAENQGMVLIFYLFVSISLYFNNIPLNEVKEEVKLQIPSQSDLSYEIMMSYPSRFLDRIVFASSTGAIRLIYLSVIAIDE